MGFPPWKLEQLAPAGESPLCILPSLPALLYSGMDRLSVKLEKGCLKNRSVPLMDVGLAPCCDTFPSRGPEKLQFPLESYVRRRKGWSLEPAREEAGLPKSHPVLPACQTALLEGLESRQ